MHTFAYKNGSLHCESVNLADIAAAVGTPVFVYSKKTIMDDLAEFRQAFAPLNAHVAYAVKACSNKAILNLLAQQGAGFDIVSGGERRDFIFSMVPAYLMGKAHLTIFKDLTAVYSTSNFHETVHADDVVLKGKTSLHIADLITEASSYERAWCPVLKAQEVKITDTVAVVDRHQGGEQTLKNLGVNMDTLVGIDKELFDEALKEGIIDQAQFDLVMSFLEDPDKYMKDFIASHPSFIDDQIALGGKNKERAELARSKGFC